MRTTRRHAHDAHEEVTSPDQHRRTISPRLAGLGAFVTIIALLLMAFFGNHEGGVEKVFLVGIAGLILLILVVDFVLRSPASGLDLAAELIHSSTRTVGSPRSPARTAGRLGPPGSRRPVDSGGVYRRTSSRTSRRAWLTSASK